MMAYAAVSTDGVQHLYKDIPEDRGTALCGSEDEIAPPVDKSRHPFADVTGICRDCDRVNFVELESGKAQHPDGTECTADCPCGFADALAHGAGVQGVRMVRPGIFENAR